MEISNKHQSQKQHHSDAMKTSRSNESSSLTVKTYLSLLQLLFYMATCDSRHIEVQRQTSLLGDKVENVLQTI